MAQTIPLFPLGSVLYPGLLLPLHVFEPRYRLLVESLLERPEPERVFGVVAIREGREVGSDGVRALHPVGCLAEVRAAERYDDGRFDLVTVGTTRFRVGALDQSLPYLRSEVEHVPEAPGDAADVLAVAVRPLLRVYRAALLAAQQQRGEDLELPGDPTALSYLVAAAVVLDLTDKQALLEAPDDSARLRSELALLRREVAVLRRLPSLPAPDLARTPVSPN